MNIAGLVYNNDDSVSSTGVSNRGIMAPHMDPNGSSYMQVHQHAEFDAYPQGYFEPHQVPQHYQAGMMSHPPQYHHPSAPYSLRQHHPQQHQQHAHHGGHPQHQHHQAPQHHQHPPQHQQMQQHHAMNVVHQPQHPHIQQAQQNIQRRGTPVQAMPQAMSQAMSQAIPQVSRDLMNGAPRTRSAMQRNQSNLSVQTQLPPKNSMQYPYQQQHQPLPTPPLPAPQSNQLQRQHQQHAPHVPQQQPQQHHRPQQIQIPSYQQQRQIQQHQLPPTPVQTTQPQQSPVQATPVKQVQSSASPTAQSPPKSAVQVEFKTDVDTLMKAIQAKGPTNVKSEPSEANSPYSTKSQMSPVTPGLYARNGFGQYGQQFNQQIQLGMAVEKVPEVVDDTNMSDLGLQEAGGKPQKARKRYPCTFDGCQKSFFQKTHLDIHIRAHSGDKPYPCKEPGCGQRFSQMGNLKTHQRRHTGEKPFECDKCHKRFAQRGNVRAHKIVHEGIKPFTCRLEECNKQFTQLGNLKSHQNKFHANNIRELTAKFATITDTEGMSRADRELFEYFADLYKNSNRGIKGRGKDRKIVGSKKPRVDDVADRHSQDSSMSPGSSVDANSVGMEHQANFGHGDVDDESSVGSPFEQPYQAQLPPLRHNQMHDPYNVRAEYYGK